MKTLTSRKVSSIYQVKK